MKKFVFSLLTVAVAIAMLFTFASLIAAGDGKTKQIKGDFTGDGKVTSADAVYLLRYTLFPERFPICDHEYTYWVTAKQATATEDGLRELWCDECGVKLREEVVPAGAVRLAYADYGDGTCFITGRGEFDGADLVIPETIDGLKVIGINGSAFYGDNALTSVVMPEGLQYINYGAFTNCNNLKTVEFPDSLTLISDEAFYGCRSLTGKLDLPAALESIGQYAFAYCGALELDLTAGNNGISVGSRVFEGTSANVTVTVPEGIEILGGVDYENEEEYEQNISKTAYIPFANYVTSVSLPSTLRIIGKNAFYNCYNLTEINIPESVTDIGYYAFYNCYNLTEIDIPESVTGIGEGAFYNCYGLTGVTIPDSVTSIGGGAFYNCTSLTSITIPDSVTSIGNYAFRNCTSLTSIAIPDSVTSVGAGAFSGCDNLTVTITVGGGTNYSESAFNACAGLYVVVPEGVEMVGNYEEETSKEYYDDYSYETEEPVIDDSARVVLPSHGSITGVSLPSTLKSIGKNAFYGCGNLEEIEIPDGVTYIGNYAFYYCGKLAEVTVPDGVKRINNYTFASCGKLASVGLPAGLVHIGQSAFADCTSLAAINFAGTLDDWEGVSKYTNSWDYYYNWDYNTGEYEVFCKVEFEPTADEYFTFTLLDDGTYSIKAKDSANMPEEVILPVKHEGKKITAIADRGFADCAGIKTLIVQSGIRTIGTRAFYNCASLEELRIPRTVSSIGTQILYKSDSIKTVYYGANYVPDNNPILNNKSIERIVFTAFPGGNDYGKESSANGLGYGENVKTIEIAAKGFIDSGTFYNGKFTTLIIHEGVTGIGYNAFGNCYSLTELVLPESLVNINQNAFKNCTSLKTVRMPQSLVAIGEYAFYNCSSLEEVYFGDDLQTIGYDAFYNCALTRVDLPASISIIGSGAFYNCPVNIINYNGTFEQWCALYSKYDGSYGSSVNPCSYLSDAEVYLNGAPVTGEAIIPEDATAITAYMFCGFKHISSVTIPETIRSIGDYAFYNCGMITEVVIPDNVTSIGGHAFGKCSSLASVTIPDSVTSIDDYAFYYCTGLTSVTIPDSVSSIGSYVFQSCTALTSVNIPDSVTSIGDAAFSGCTGLTSVTIGNSVTSIGTNAFYNCTALTSITVPGSVKSIGTSAFYNCTGLTSVTIPGSVTSIGYATFSGCTGLTSVTIGNGVTSIGYYAFQNCTGLTSVTIPDSVINIDNYAFYGCTGLTSVTIPDSVTWIGECAFRYCTALTDINYSGTTEQWNSIGKYYYWNNDTGDYVIHCTDGSFDKNGYLIKGGLKFTREYEESDEEPEEEDYIYYVRGVSNDFAGGGIVIPATVNGHSVTSIGYAAFSGCTGLTSVTIPESVTYIGGSAFESCTGLTSVTIPDSVTSISSSAFQNCTGLTDIYFSGTKEQWNSIGKAWDWNYYTGYYVIHCTDGDIT